jgi:hypothetical protein
MIETPAIDQPVLCQAVNLLSHSREKETVRWDEQKKPDRVANRQNTQPTTIISTTKAVGCTPNTVAGASDRQTAHRLPIRLLFGFFHYNPFV